MDTFFEKKNCLLFFFLSASKRGKKRPANLLYKPAAPGKKACAPRQRMSISGIKANMKS